MISSRPIRARSCIISSARTFCISTRCSGRRCCRPRTCAAPRPCTRMAFSPSTARRCRSRAARSSPRASYLQNFPAEYLRYYFAAKLGPGIDDMDMNLDEFATRLNSEIVGKLVNIASRCAGFITRDLGRQVGGQPGRSRPVCGIRQRRRGHREELRAAAIPPPPSATSWRFAIAPINMSIRASPGCSPRIRRMPPKCRASAPRP